LANPQPKLTETKREASNIIRNERRDIITDTAETGKM
jgi:hypothetical protein